MVAKHNGVRTDLYKLIHFYEFDEWEFYDLEKDPEESTNQYDNPQYSSTIGDLKQQLEDLREHYRDNTDMRVKPAAWQQKFRGEQAAR